MADPRALAARYGIAVEIDDLGTWGGAALNAEYDPAGPTIRINRRVLEGLGDSCLVRDAIDAALAHELYHHREAIGEVARLASHAERERAAERFAERLLAGEAE